LHIEDQDWPKKVKKIYGDLMKDLNLEPKAVTFPAGEVVARKSMEMTLRWAARSQQARPNSDRFPPTNGTSAP